ncbi:MAG: hypothetical protein EXR28_17750 [Betaproteobacteria bacterium]|nr:hypothetical protein [Betaproteobacteria bacterium]
MSISDWPLADRPRERLLGQGAQVLADAELLVICLRTGIPGKSAVDLARDLIAEFGSLRVLLSASASELAARRGLGNAKAAQLLACVELTRRSLREEIEVHDALASPQAVRDYLRLLLARQDREVFVAVMLDAQHRVKATEELFHGTLTQTSVYP